MNVSYQRLGISRNSGAKIPAEPFNDDKPLYAVKQRGPRNHHLKLSAQILEQQKLWEIFATDFRQEAPHETVLPGHTTRNINVVSS